MRQDIDIFTIDYHGIDRVRLYKELLRRDTGGALAIMLNHG